MMNGTAYFAPTSEIEFRVENFRENDFSPDTFSSPDFEDDFPSGSTDGKTHGGLAKSKAVVLLVGANPATRSAMRHFLESEHFLVRESGWGDQIRSDLKKDVDFVLIDASSKNAHTDLMCKFIRDRDPHIPVLVMDDPGPDTERRRTIIRCGCSHLNKPCDRLQLLSIMNPSIRMRQFARENERLRELAGDPILPMSIPGTSLAAQTLTKQIEAFGRLDNTVLISGERGTGKNIIAQLVHQAGERAHKPFLVISCDAYPAEILEADLFGYMHHELGETPIERMGRLEQLSGGTLYLDRVEYLSPPVQAKLVAYLQERTFRPLGARELRTADTRIIASTRGGLAVACAQGRFREDLFFRLSSMSITAPPLRERAEDIQPLSREIVSHLARLFGTNQPILSANAIQKLRQHSWPGNISELETVLYRAMISARDTILSESDIAFDPGGLDHGSRDGSMGLAGLSMADIERRAIIETIHACGGNRAQSAQKLGISEKTIYNKIKQFKLRGIV